MKYDPLALQNWHKDHGDTTHNLNYDLSDRSVVVDLGGFRGVWAEMLLERLKPKSPEFILVEPVPDFYNYLCNKFSKEKNVKVIHGAVSTNGEKVTRELFVSGDASSMNYKVGSSLLVPAVSIDEIIGDHEVIDLMQVNIEGDEYALMEYLLDSGLILKFRNLQVQYHLGIENDRSRREDIRCGLLKAGFELRFDYPFVWEGWSRY